jgi:hypothetical protein
MNWIYEQPLVVLIVGAVLSLAVAAAWASTGKRWLLVPLILTILLTVGGLVAERLIVTDREAIQDTLLAIARDVEANDIQALSRHIYSGAPQLKAKADAELPNYKFKSCRVTKVHTIDVDATIEPRSAIVDFNVVAEGSFKDGSFEYSDAVRRWVRLHMVREQDGRWAVQDYDHQPPQQMMFSEPLNE